MKKVFIFLLIIFMLIGNGCGSAGDMSGIKNLVRQDIFNQKEEKYYVFFYRETCDGCEQTKPYILAYINALKEEKYQSCRKIYGVNLSNEKNYTMYVKNTTEGGQGTDDAFWVDGVTNWEELKIGSTPSIISIYVKDGIKTASYVAQGKEKIIAVLNKQLDK